MNQKKEQEILQTICPISFENGRADGSRRMGEQVDGCQMRNNNYTYCTPTAGSDILRNCQEKIGYQIMKSQIELEEQHNRLEQRYDFEKRLAGLKINYRIYLELMASTVYRDSAGNIVYAISDEGGKTIASKILLNVKEFRSKMYISYYPKTQSVFEIAWGEEDRNKILFECTKDGISPREFLRRLKSRGVLLLVSGKTESKAAQALLSYSFLSAEECEIPFDFGWGMDKVGKWHFASKNELTMRGLRKDA